jgi:hypothetical protein
MRDKCNRNDIEGIVGKSVNFDDLTKELNEVYKRIENINNEFNDLTRNSVLRNEMDSIKREVENKPN